MHHSPKETTPVEVVNKRKSQPKGKLKDQGKLVPHTKTSASGSNVNHGGGEMVVVGVLKPALPPNG